jgi:hypothetical protein
MKTLLFAFLLFLAAGAADGQSLTTRTVQDRYKETNYDLFEGKVKARQTNPRALVVSFSTSDPSAYDRAFVLTAEKDIVFENFSSEKAHAFIHVSQRFAVIVDDVTEQVYILGLDEEATAKELELLKSDQAIGSHVSGSDFLGFGMSYVTGSWKIESLEKCTYLNPFNYLGSGDLTGKAGYNAADELNGGSGLCDKGVCTSGGAGSDNCEITEDYVGIHQTCKVTCKAGYYSCCVSKTTRCYCCKDH